MMLVGVRRRDLRMHEGIWATVRATEQCTRQYYACIMAYNGGKQVYVDTRL